MGKKIEIAEGDTWSDLEDTPYEPIPVASNRVKESPLEYETEGTVRSLQETVTAIQSNLDRALEVLGSIERKLGACA